MDCRPDLVYVSLESFQISHEEDKMTDYIARELQGMKKHPIPAIASLILSVLVMLSPCIICALVSQ